MVFKLQSKMSGILFGDTIYNCGAKTTTASSSSCRRCCSIRDTLTVPLDHSFGYCPPPEPYGLGDLLHNRPDSRLLRGRSVDRSAIAVIRNHLKKANYNSFDNLLHAFKFYDKVCVLTVLLYLSLNAIVFVTVANLGSYHCELVTQHIRIYIVNQTTWQQTFVHIFAIY